jgi:phage shock protein PspC (stress-responsive transcriptional regulator)
MTATTANHDTAGDNLFGVCAAIAGEFGFNPLWLRLAFAVTFLASPEIVAGTYFALGAVVLIARLVAPRRKRSTGVTAALMPTPIPAREEKEVELPLAA